jgi:acetyltransferase-like isoleucine patch superfamily enzyme
MLLRLLHGIVCRVRRLRLSLICPPLRGGGRVIVAAGVAVHSSGSFERGAALQLARGVYVHIAKSGRLVIGDNVYIGRGANVSCYEHVLIGNDVRLGERVSIHDENHVFEPIPVDPARRHLYQTTPVRLGDRVWVGANSVILPGAEVGDDCVIGAGSVVRGVIPPGCLAAGAPARVIRRLTSSE